MNKKLLLLAAVSQFPFAGAALAQDKPEGASADDGTIVVTARRREEALQDVPISVSALSGEALAARGVRDALDLQYQTPSLSVTSTGSTTALVAYSIRGQRTNETQLLTDPPVGVYFSEVVMPHPVGFNANYYDLQNIQVLKGVQGTLFGRNMTGGAVLVEPAHPDLGKLGASVTGQYGNLDMVDVTGMINVPLIQDTLGIRLAGKYRDRKGYTKEVSSGLDLDDQHYYAFRGSFELQTGDLTSFTVFDYAKVKQHGSGLKLVGSAFIDPVNGQPTVVALQAGASPYFPVAAGSPPQDLGAIFASDLALGRHKVNYANFSSGPLSNYQLDPFQRIKNWGITNKTSLDVGDVTFKNIFGYRKINFTNHNDLDGSGAALLEPIQISNSQVVSNEFQMQGNPFGENLDLTLGAFYLKEWGEDGSMTTNFAQLTSIGFASAVPPAYAPFYLLAPPGYYAQTQINSATASSWALYGAGTYRFSPEVSLSAGIRYNRDSRKATVRPTYDVLSFVGGVGSCNFDGADTYPLASCAFTKLLKNEAVTWDVTLQYQPDDTLNAYVAARKGYRAGGFSLRANSSATFQPFLPEKVQEYELGLKKTFDLGGGRLSTNLALFYQKYTDIQKQNNVLDPSGTQIITVITNTAAQNNYGGEFEANLALDGGLSFNLFYSYIGIDVKRDASGSYPYQGTPKHQLGGGVTYSHDVGLGELNANANFTYRTKMPLDEFDAIGFQKGYAIVNARLALDNIGGTGFGAALFGSNLTNTYYQVGGVYLLSGGSGALASGGPGFASATYGEPRTYGVELSYKF